MLQIIQWKQHPKKKRLSLKISKNTVVMIYKYQLWSVFDRVHPSEILDLSDRESHEIPEVKDEVWGWNVVDLVWTSFTPSECSQNLDCPACIQQSCFTKAKSMLHNTETETFFSYLWLLKTNIPWEHSIVRLNNNSKYKSKENDTYYND